LLEVLRVVAFLATCFGSNTEPSLFILNTQYVKYYI
jgi:hypothetical protein